MNDEPITQYLAYLLAQANRQMTAQLERALRDEGVQIEHWRILEVLSDEQGRSMGELAEAVLMNHPALTKTMDRMVSRGLAHRRADPVDSRRVLVYITDRGLDLVSRLRSRVDRHHDAVVAAVGEKKAGQLKKLLSDLIRNTE
ncbi:MAG TPA: MarR family transcriptional regulator [Burkholderiales bacterium]|nr:MarR family transcriptional regulator [Burkholderiales bacterium]